MTRLLQAAVSIFAWIGISVMTLWWTLLIFAVFLVHPLMDRDRRICHRLAGFWGRTLVRLASLRPVEISGQENIPAGRPLILVANHQSYVDVPLLFHVPGQFKWMADEGLFRIPVFGWAMWMAGYVSVRRGDPRQGLRALEQAREWLNRKISIFIFPEGTRSHTGVLGRFQTGAFRLAFTTRTPMVPVVVVGTRQLLPRGRWTFRWGVRLKIRVLAPVRPEDFASPRELARHLRKKMRDEYARVLTCRVR